ncbi:ABC transporter permease [Hyphomicrobium sp. CS1GBMeth3]|uniref:ABC transporter permease n=1 Tax=Hyphomicrobium sp. CS1GBMeth3 TaxID=1892845 RepID=UPI000930E414|nr:ABC transporter permease [Hyphomicrobium sp. CS1GBMeth3]
MDLFLSILLGIVIAATPLVFASIGELVAERSGVLNLGVEGMMVIGAIAAFAATYATGSYFLGGIAGALAGAAMGGLFGVLTLTLMSNQVATGLALTMFGLGLSALIGQSYSGISLGQFPKVDIPVLTDLPFIGPLLFGQDAFVYLSIALVLGVAWFLTKSRGGLILRAIGENHDAAHAIGYSVIGIRYLAVMFGGACAGLGGAYLSLVQTPLWVEKMTAGRGWIALALVVFASWRPLRLLAGAYLFGGITILQLHSQGLGIKIDAQILSMLPYLATILVLVIISRDRMKMKLNAPACLGKGFYATG